MVTPLTKIKIVQSEKEDMLPGYYRKHNHLKKGK